MRQPRRLKIPARAHPLVKQLWIEMNDQRIGLQDACERAGIFWKTPASWTHRNSPKLVNVEALGNALGLELKWVRKK